MSTTPPISRTDLEYPCPTCEGDGWCFDYEAHYEPEECTSCKGLGVRLTPNGDALLNFVKRHLYVEGEVLKREDEPS